MGVEPAAVALDPEERASMRHEVAHHWHELESPAGTPSQLDQSVVVDVDQIAGSGGGDHRTVHRTLSRLWVPALQLAVQLVPDQVDEAADAQLLRRVVDEQEKRGRARRHEYERREHGDAR